MLIAAQAWAAGSVSGGCLEGNVLETAWERTAHGPAVVTYDSTSDDDIIWGFGLGCQGTVTVLFERVDGTPGPLEFLEERVTSRTTGVIATAISGPQLGSHWYLTSNSEFDSPILAAAKRHEAERGVHFEEIDGATVLFESVHPPQALTIFGAGHDAIPLCEAAKSMGWFVSVIDHRPAYALRDRFPRADKVLHAVPSDVGSKLQLEPAGAVVVMTHHYMTDLEILDRVIRLPLIYVGQLGPFARTARILEELRNSGGEITREQLARFHAPIGLDLGGASPEEVAIAIIAEIQAVRNQRDGASLAGRSGPLHDPQPPVVIGATGEAAVCDLSR